MSINVIVHGASGRMGSEVVKLCGQNYKDTKCVARVALNGEGGSLASLNEYTGQADVIVDFSFHGTVGELMDYAIKRKIPVVVATTGHNEEELQIIKDAAEKIPVFHSANMSIGVALLCELAVKTASVFPDADIEIVEHHHNRKIDAPSGTALMLANALSEAKDGAPIVSGRDGHMKRNPGEISVCAVRRGNIVGIHEVYVSTDTQTITLTHEAHDRALFAEGALSAAAFIKGKKAGIYTVQDMIRQEEN